MNTRLERRSIFRRDQSSPYRRPTKATKSSSWLTGLLNFMNPLRIDSKSPEPSLEPVRKPTPEHIVVDDDDDDERANPVNVTPPVNHPPAERIPIRAIRPLEYTELVHRDSRAAESFEPLPDLQPTVSLDIPTIAYTSPASANYSRMSLSAIASMNTNSTPAKSSTAIADLTPPDPTSSSAEHLAKVAAFLESKHKNGEALNEMESAGILAFIREVQAEADAKPSPFRFANTGVTNSPSPFATTQAPRKLKSNPNGVYRYEGPGSARPRPRVHSPAFGPMHPPNPLRLPDLPLPEAKRRRIDGEDSIKLMPPPPAPATPTQTPAPPQTRTHAESPPQAQATPSPPRVSIVVPNTPDRSTTDARARALSPTSAPAVPSPLRQSWSDSYPDAAPESTVPSTTLAKGAPTKAADLVTSIIKEATPSNKISAITNPYQMASPVKNPAFKRRRPRAFPPLRKEEVRKTDVLPQLSAIESTIPKGSKRSCPSSESGAHLPKDKHEKSAQGTSPRKHKDAAEDESPRASKKQKQDLEVRAPPDTGMDVNHSQEAVHGVETTSTSTGEIVDDDIEIIYVKTNNRATKTHESLPNGMAPNPKTFPTVGSPFSNSSQAAPQGRGLGQPFTVKSSVPKEPSKLRFSYQPSTSSASAESTPPTSTTAPLPTSLSTSTTEPMPVSLSQPTGKPPPVLLPAAAITPPSASPPARTVTPPASLPAGTTASAPVSLPIPTITPPPASVPASTMMPPPASLFSHSVDLPSALLPPPTLFPSTTATTPPTSVTSAPITVSATLEAKPRDFQAEAMAIDVDSLPTYQFVFSESSMDNNSHASAKSVARGKSVDTLPSFDLTPASGHSGSGGNLGFNWAAAGVKPPAITAGQWTCAMCGLKNPMTATNKCGICDAIRPAPASNTMGGFNWAAAGMKQPSSGGTWTCGTCMLANPASAVDKCGICDATRK